MRRIMSIVLGPCMTLFLATGGFRFAGTARATGVTLTVNAGQPGPKISPTMFGLMFEEINHSGDGGIYGELIANRNLHSSLTPLDDWFLVRGSHSHGSIDLDSNRPVNTTALSQSLRLTITHVNAGERVGVSNDGFHGIPVRPSTTYRASVYARASANFKGPLTLSIESAGGKMFAAARTAALTTSWRQYTVTLTTPSGIKPSENNVFVLSATHTGIVWLSLASLFPPTWNNRPNGLRVDLMQDLSDLHPGFLRFPGGNYLEGESIDTRFNWKETIGPIA
ncbi:MAG: carbohydrate binding domain-containing protein, partial [Chloroflexota bacterium]